MGKRLLLFFSFCMCNTKLLDFPKAEIQECQVMA